jgi:ParB-like chromosome segregation protein Spo0J
MITLRDIPIKQIKLAKYNPRKTLKPGDPAYEKLKKAIARFDLVEPLVWNKRSANLVGGHQRLRVLKDRGDKTVQVSVVDLEERDEKALNLALNKHAGEWDNAMLSDLLAELNTGDFDLEIAGFDQKELEKLTGWNEPSEEKPGSGDGSLAERYAVLVECTTESEQARLLEEFTTKGLKCKALIV